jgi:cytosine/uracil/thiamine/allantoin permease
LKRSPYGALTRSRKVADMLRNLFGFVLFAVLTMFVLKLLFGLFGLVLGLLGAVLWFAFLGFLIYLVLKVFAPETAARVREMIAGH